MDTDADIRATAHGDHQAFGRVVAVHQGRIFAFLGRMGINRAAADDIAQDTFLRVWRNAGAFDPDRGGLATWILTIARNQALTWLARPNRETGEIDANTASSQPGPDALLCTRQHAARLHAALALLAPADRSLLAASYFDDLPLADIARIEGCSPGAAKVRLHRARTRLRHILETTDV